MSPNNRYISKAKSYQQYLWLLKPIKAFLVLGLLWLIYSQLQNQSFDRNLLDTVLSTSISKIGFASVVLMMILNWHFEITKWRLLIGKFEKLSYWQGFKSVASGISLAIITPARVGEYGGRLISISHKNKPKAILANVISSIAQNIANVSMGLIGMVYYLFTFLNMGPYTTMAVICIVIPILILAGIALFRLDLIQDIGKKYEGNKVADWLSKQTEFLALYSRSEISRVLFISFLRYSIYTSQYVILVLLCGVTANPIYALMGVTVIFFIQSGIPLPPMLSVLARGEIAIWIWSVFSGDVAAILLATFLLWFINLIVPALIGAGVIWSSDLSASE